MRILLLLLLPAALLAEPLPPYVLIGNGKLICNISSTKNGIQKLTLRKGSGVSFDISVTPIIDGVISLKKSKKMNYRFTSRLFKTKNFAVTGFGPVKLLDLKTKVSVNTLRYQQPKGPGTRVSFNSNDMDRKGVYVEFQGTFRQIDTSQKFSFRTLLGPPTTGKGAIDPYDSNDSSRIVAKRVVVEIEQTPSRPFTQIVTTIQEIK